VDGWVIGEEKCSLPGLAGMRTTMACILVVALAVVLAAVTATLSSDPEWRYLGADSNGAAVETVVLVHEGF
jgi:hypothetical protein